MFSVNEMKKNKFSEQIRASDLINIQKLVFLLDESHYDLFVKHLENKLAKQSAKLIRAIKAKLPLFHHHEDLCMLIYGDNTPSSRTRFNQLTLTSFKASEYLAVMYPGYLLHNLTLIEDLIAKQQLLKAQFLAHLLLDVAEKICDFTTQIYVLKFMCNQEYMFKRPQKAKHFYELMKISQEYSKTMDDIHHLLRNDFSTVNLAVKKGPDEIYPALEYLKKYHSSPIKSISLLSWYSSISIRHYFQIETDNLYTELTDFEKEYNKHSYILMPYLFDIKTSCSFIRLTIPGFDINDKDGIVFIHTYKKHYDSVGYWRSYLNMPKLYILMMKAKEYIERYGSLLHHNDYPDMLPGKVKADIEETSAECLDMIARDSGVEAYMIDMINLRMITGGLLILRGGSHIKDGINQVEQSINSFQQIKKSCSVGSLYLILIMGYFALSDYKQCLATYTRYLKVSKNRDMYEQIDIKIHIYYNFARWLFEKDMGFIKILKKIYKYCSNDPSQNINRVLIERLAEYFGAPISGGSEMTSGLLQNG